MDYSKPVPGKLMFEALKNEKCIVMACNIRIGASTRGIMMAAKEKRASDKVKIMLASSQPCFSFPFVIYSLNKVVNDRPTEVPNKRIKNSGTIREIRYASVIRLTPKRAPIITVVK